MAVAGGMGRLWGGVLGVVVFTWLPELLRGVANWQPVIFGSVTFIHPAARRSGDSPVLLGA